jgi:transposase InsO family protein
METIPPLNILNLYKWNEEKAKEMPFVRFNEDNIPYIGRRRIIYYEDVDKTIKEELPKIWADLPSNSGRDRVNRIVSDKFIGLPRAKIFEWMKGQEDYQRSQPILKVSRTQSIITSEPDSIWQSDVFTMSKFPKNESIENSYSKVLIVIDNFSKKIWIRAMRTDNTNEIIRGLKDILQSNVGRKPKRFLTDKGGSYTSKQFKEFMIREGIRTITTRGGNPTGNALSERKVRESKSQLYSLMRKKDTDNWPQFLPALELLNNTNKSRTTLRTANDLYEEKDKEIQKQVEERSRQQYEKRKFQFRKIKPLEIGDKVRLNSEFSGELSFQDAKDVGKKIKNKATMTGLLWSKKVYTIKSVLKDGMVYKLVERRGLFPREAMQKIILPQED